MYTYVYRANINSPGNQAVVAKLISEVQGMNPSYDAADIIVLTQH